MVAQGGTNGVNTSFLFFYAVAQSVRSVTFCIRGFHDPFKILKKT